MNTKEAMRLVMGMFNASLELEKPSVIQEDVDMQEPNPTPIHNEGKVLPKAELMKFALFKNSEKAQII